MSRFVYSTSLYVAEDKNQTIKFYKELFDFHVIQDFGTNFTFTGGFCFQTRESWRGFLDKPDDEIVCGGNDGEIYIETEDLDEFLDKLNQYDNIQYLHKLKEHAWGQRGIRFYDPNMHIIEVSESLKTLCQRFFAQGLSIIDISVRVGISENMVRKMLEK